MMRLHDWPQRLDAYVEGAMNRPFEWGVHDCCRFAAGAVKAIVGTDPMSEYEYSSEREALRMIASAGTLEALVRRRLGDPRPSPAFAKRGDIVLADLEFGEAVGVCLGSIAAFGAIDGGITWRPMHACRVAWEIS